MDSRRWNLRKIGIDFSILCCVSLPLLFYWLFGRPFQRGFFCNDESIRHPFRDSTVENWMLAFIGVIIPVLIIVITEKIKSASSSDSQATELLQGIPPWLRQSFKHTGYLLYCTACTLLITFIGKYSVGRFRPHFYTVCLPVMADGTTCNDTINHNRYIEKFTCQNKDSTEFELSEMRLSFPSGHASLSAAAMVFCAMYLQARMTWRGSTLLRNFFQFIMLTVALFTGLSRISDYMHHWSDVLIGLILGTVVAVITAIYVSDMLIEKKQLHCPLILQARDESKDEEILSGSIKPIANV